MPGLRFVRCDDRAAGAGGSGKYIDLPDCGHQLRAELGEEYDRRAGAAFERNLPRRDHFARRLFAEWGHGNDQLRNRSGGRVGYGYGDSFSDGPGYDHFFNRNGIIEPA